MPRGCVIYIPQIPYSHWCIHTPMVNIGIDDVLYTYRRGASALLVSTCKAISYEPQNVKRAIVQGFTLFLCLTKTT